MQWVDYLLGFRMATKKYLLVCEGPTDFEILSAISKNIENKNGHSIEIVPLSPQIDATSGSYPPHGWTAVRLWCKSNRVKSQGDVASLDDKLREVALRKNWLALVAVSGADGLIIQLDTDIAEHIVDLAPPFLGSGVTRREFCDTAIAKWLGVKKIHPNMFLVLSSHSTETWLLAMHDPEDAVFADLTVPFNYEDIPDPEDRLLVLGYKKKSGRLHKKPSVYEGYAHTLVGRLTQVRQRCVEAEVFCDFIESV